MKVVIDTNVFISGIFWGGKPLLVLDHWIRDDFILLISKTILDEYSKTLYEISKGRRDDLVDKWIFNISTYSELVQPNQHFQICRDKDDNKWLDCAVAGSADFIISGDKDLLSLKSIFPIKIVQLADFLRLLKSQD